jgi:energy-coupling factor transport system ATP-binding protein
LSVGQRQRIGIARAFLKNAPILLLDEPTSALDPTGAEEVLAAITRLVHDLGVTVVVAEHRLERVVQYADAVVRLPGDGTVDAGEPDDVLARSTVVPPIVELGVASGWQPLPLSVRDARRRATALAELLAGVDPPPAVTPPAAAPEIALRARGVVVRHGAVVAVRDVDVDLRRGEMTALMGRNGAGKSSLLWSLQGSGTRTSGRVDVGGADPAALPPARARQLVGLVPHNPSDLLFLDAVAEELARSDAEANASTGATRVLLDRLAPGITDNTHPRDLSEGQRLVLVLAIQLVAAPTVVLLDEPTRGLDYRAKHDLRHILSELAGAGHAIAVATHDVEFVAATAHRVIVMAEGEIVADGPTADVIVASPAFAPQVAKILAPRPWLTVEQLVRVGAFEPSGAPR